MTDIQRNEWKRLVELARRGESIGLARVMVRPAVLVAAADEIAALRASLWSVEQGVLEAAGFRIGDAGDFLELADDERRLVELWVAEKRAEQERKDKERTP